MCMDCVCSWRDMNTNESMSIDVLVTNDPQSEEPNWFPTLYLLRSAIAHHEDECIEVVFSCNLVHNDTSSSMDEGDVDLDVEGGSRLPCNASTLSSDVAGVSIEYIVSSHNGSNETAMPQCSPSVKSFVTRYKLSELM